MSDKAVDMKLAKTVIFLRKREGMGQADFAGKVGVSPSTIYHIEKGVGVKLKTLRKLAEKSELSVRQIQGLDPLPSPLQEQFDSFDFTELFSGKAGSASIIAPSTPQLSTPPNTRSIPLPIFTADTIERWGVAQVTRLVEAVETRGGPVRAVERLEGAAGRIGGVPDEMMEELGEIARAEKMTPEQFLRAIIDQARERQSVGRRRIAAKDEGKKRE